MNPDFVTFKARAVATPSAIAALIGLVPVISAEIADDGSAVFYLQGELMITMEPVSDGTTIWSLRREGDQ